MRPFYLKINAKCNICTDLYPQITLPIHYPYVRVIVFRKNIEMLHLCVSDNCYTSLAANKSPSNMSLPYLWPSHLSDSCDISLVSTPHQWLSHLTNSCYICLYMSYTSREPNMIHNCQRTYLSLPYIVLCILQNILCIVVRTYML